VRVFSGFLTLASVFFLVRVYNEREYRKVRERMGLGATVYLQNDTGVFYLTSEACQELHAHALHIVCNNFNKKNCSNINCFNSCASFNYTA